MKRKGRHLYRGEQGSETRTRIVAYYEEQGESPARARESYGRIVGKVAREQAAKEGGTKVERVKRHRSRSAKGRREEVRAHDSTVRADEDDLPRRHSGSHDVESFDRTVDGRREHVRGHRARNPRR